MRMPRLHPHMLRHTFVTTMLDAGVDLRDVQIAARHADPRTTMRYDRARKNLDRTPTASSPPAWRRGRSPLPGTGLAALTRPGPGALLDWVHGTSPRQHGSPTPGAA